MIPSHQDRVLPEWVDANGHMNLAYYVLVFDRATDAVFGKLGVGNTYREQAACALFAAEAHTLYEREVHEGAELQVSTAVVGADGKRLHLAHEMRAATGARVAAQELMYVHVDLRTRRSTPFPTEVAQHLRGAAGAPRPEWLGRRVALPG